MKPIQFHVTAMTAPDVFHECIAWCMHGLKAAGYDVSYADASLRADAINIVLGSYCTPDTWASLSAQAPHIIIYNWEPAAADHGRFTQRYIRCLHNTHVWDYSRNNVHELQTYAGVQDIHYVPMSYVPAMRCLEPAPIQDIDVLFYGTMYPRRTATIASLRALGLTVVTSEECNEHMVGQVRDRYLARAKVVLNMHAFDDVHVFEMARISYLLANSKAVVSEVSSHTDIDEDLRGAIMHGDLETLPQLCWDLVHDDEKRHALEQHGHQLFQQRDAASIMSTAVQRYLIQRAAQPPLIGNTQPLSLPLPQQLHLSSGSIEQGFNERWSYRHCNIDVRSDFSPDLVLDISQPLPFTQTLKTVRFGNIILTLNYFTHINAQKIFQHSKNPVCILNNCLQLLQDGGTLDITVSLNLAHEAWTDIDERRAFTEQSWQTISDDWMQYSDGEYRFELKNSLTRVNNAIGYEILKSNDNDWAASMKVPRAIERQNVTLHKRRLNEIEQKSSAQKRYLD